MSQTPDQAPPVLPDAPAPPSTVRRAPPTVPGPLGVVRREPEWPKVLGIIGIVLGSFGIISGMLTFVGARVGSKLPLSMSSDSVLSRMESGYRGLQITKTIFGVALMLAALVLIVGSIGLLRQRGWSFWVLLFWSILKLALGAVGAWIAVVVQSEINQAMTIPSSRGDFASIFEGITTLLWLGASPVFALIWLVWPANRAEFKRWRSSDRSHIPARPPA